VDWSRQTLYRNGSGLEYADCLQKSGSGSGSGVDWSIQTVCRRVEGVVGLSIQNISEAHFGDHRRICAVGQALKVTSLSSFEMLVQANVIYIPDSFTFIIYRSSTIFLI
jgi:hypothetical protein